MSDTHKIYIYGEIDSGNDRGTFSDLDLKEILDGLEPNQDITVHINSLGGRVDTGLAIYNLLKKWQGHVTTVVDGFCCSIASAILLAGDTVIASDNSLIMIHKPLMATQGNDTELLKQIGTLQKVEATLVNIYQEKTGLSSDEIKAMLEAETWLDASESLHLGFIDRIETTDTKAVASLYETVLAKLDVPKEIQEKLNQLKVDLSQQEPPKPKKKGSKKLNKREILNAIAEVRSQHEGKDDKEIMLAHAGFDLLLNKLAEVEAKESQNKMTNLKQEDKEGEISFMENEKKNGLKIYSKAEPIKIDRKPEEESLTLGGIVKALISGQTSNQAEQNLIRNAVSGSVLIPETLSKMLIQESRNRSALNRSGMLTTVMNTPKVVIGREVQLPKAHFKLENDPIQEATMSFEGVELNSKVVTSIIRISQEQADDITGIETLIANSLSQAIAEAVDLGGLAGDGVDPNPLGLLNVEGIEKVTLETPLAEMVDTSEISKLVGSLKGRNIDPKVVVMNAGLESAIDLQKNSLGDPIKHAPSYDALSKVVSNQVDDNIAIVGDFEKGLLMGIHKDIIVEATNKDEKSWNNLQKSVRVHARVAFAVLDKKAFAILEGTQGA